MAEPIKDTTGLPNILTQLLGQQGSTSTAGNTLAQQLQTALTGQQSSGTTSGTTTNTAELGPLIQAFTQASQGMTPEMLTQLITSVFTEGAQAVPALTQQFANSTGSRVSGNSGLNLALGDLNRNLSSQVVDRLLQYNQQQQQTAANAAAQIANNTRQTQQTGQTATNNTTQQQTQGTTNTQQTQQQQQRQGTNPNNLALLGLGGSALNWLDKKGALDWLTGGGKGGGVGTIAGGGSLVPNATSSAGPMLTNGGGSAGLLSTPSASSGFLATPVAANPYGVTPTVGGGGMTGLGGSGAGGAPTPSISFPSGGITGLGGYTTPGGGIGTGMDFGFGTLPNSFNAFGTLGSESLGSNLNFGSNPFGYGGTAGGITDAVGSYDSGTGGMFSGLSDFDLGNAVGNFGSGLTDVFGGFGDLLGGAWDAIGSLFANGGMIGPRRGYADGGQIDTGTQPQRVRNQNFMGGPLQREREAAINYEGYAPGGGAVGASQPAGGSPSLSLGASFAPASLSFSQGTAGTPGTMSLAGGMTPQQQAQALWTEQVMRGQMAAEAARIAQGGAGGSGGIGEGAAPGQNEADNGQAGIGPSGIAAAPQGTGQAVSTALGLMGMPAPGLSTVLALMAALASQVNAANQAITAGYQSTPTAGGGGPGGVDASAPSDDSPDIGVSVSVPGLDGISDNANDGGSGGSSSGGSDGVGDAASAGVGGGGFNNGGLIRGSGTGTSDSIKVKSREPGGKDIHYSDGEYVIPADVVNMLGAQHFDALIDAFHTPV